MVHVGRLQRRVELARALALQPSFLVLDKPTSALDADRRLAFVDLLFRECEREGDTLVFVSHDAMLASRFDRAIEFADINSAENASTGIAK